MTEKEMAQEYEKNAEYIEIDDYGHKVYGSQDIEQAYLAGLKAGIGKLRYCCTCKKWKECVVVSMYGICANWEIKE